MLMENVRTLIKLHVHNPHFTGRLYMKQFALFFSSQPLIIMAIKLVLNAPLIFIISHYNAMYFIT